MFESAGESCEREGLFYRCPGMECPDFKSAAGATWREKAENACTACRRCKGNFPLDPDEPVPDGETDVGNLVGEVEQLILEQNAGEKIDWTINDPDLFELVVEWRRAEAEINRLHQGRLQMFIKAHFTDK